MTPDASVLSDRTWADLDLDAVFANIDRTVSTLGREALYHRLRITSTPAQLLPFEALVSRMSEDRPTRERARTALARLQDPHGYDVWWMSQPDALESKSWYVLFPFLTAAAIAAVALIPISVAPVVTILIVNLAFRAASNESIGRIARSFRQLAPIIATAQALRVLSGDDIQPIVQPMTSDTPRLLRIKLLSRWSNDNVLMLSHGANPLATIVNDVFGAVYEYVNTLFLLDATGVYFGANDLRAQSSALLRVVAAIGDVDAAISVATYRKERAVWSRPVFTEGREVIANDLCHPLLADPTPNSLQLRLGDGVLVTGSNMAGKSTFLRTVGVNAVLAQAINTCAAREYSAPWLRVSSCIGRSDDLIAGKSYYLAEVEALLELVRQSEGDQPHLFLLDELFRGTNAVERVAAAHAVLFELLDDGSSKPHLVLAATHDGELTEMLRPLYESFHFSGSLSADGLVFDHRLRRGPATTRTAIALLEHSGAPARLVSRAMATAASIDQARTTPH